MTRKLVLKDKDFPQGQQHFTETSSTLKVLRECAIQIHLLTYWVTVNNGLLTYIHIYQ